MKKKKPGSSKSVELVNDETGLELLAVDPDFGSPERIGNWSPWRETLWLDHFGYYEPPIPFNTLVDIVDVVPELQSSIAARRNSFVTTFKAHPLVSRAVMEAAIVDYEYFGHALLYARRSILGNLLRIEHIPMVTTRIGRENRVYQIGMYGEKRLLGGVESVIQIKDPAPHSTIYGYPWHSSIIKYAILGDASTLFRIRYFQNGAHVGYIYYFEGKFPAGMIDKIKEQIRNSKGAGAFQSLILHNKGDKEGKVEIKPLGEISGKDEFSRIQEVVAAKALIIKRTPPTLLSVIPKESSFGDQSKAMINYAINEIGPLQADFAEAINPYLPDDQPLRFDSFAALIADVER